MMALHPRLAELCKELDCAREGLLAALERSLAASQIRVREKPCANLAAY
jgi:hypothetical protein